MWRPVKSDALHGVSRMNDVSTSNRQLRIWVHASAFDEAFGVLSTASREQVVHLLVLISLYIITAVSAYICVPFIFDNIKCISAHIQFLT